MMGMMGMTGMVEKAVILAAGLGTRMRREVAGSRLHPDQEAAASQGMKGMMPIGRPFLDYVISALADAGLQDVCIVVGPRHDAIRAHYAGARPSRVRLAFAVQSEPIGTAHATLAAEEFAGGDEFLLLNSDNYYPVSAYRALVALGEPGLPVFERERLLALGNFPRERVSRYARLAIGADGYLAGIVEKPVEAAMGAAGGEVFLSMNLWRFRPDVFEACRRVPRSARGEFELPQAVDYAIRELGRRFRTVPCDEGVLDLSTRADVAAVAARLRGVEVRL